MHLAGYSSESTIADPGRREKQLDPRRKWIGLSKSSDARRTRRLSSGCLLFVICGSARAESCGFCCQLPRSKIYKACCLRDIIFPVSQTQMKPGCYRLRLFKDLCSAIVLPCASLWLALRFCQVYPRLIISTSLYPAFIVLWAIGKGFLNNWGHARRAQQLGAQPIPRVVGRWPGNIDVLLRMIKSFKTSYVLDVYLQLFEEYQCTTLNTRILWVDNVSAGRPGGAVANPGIDHHHGSTAFQVCPGDRVRWV